MQQSYWDFKDDEPFSKRYRMGLMTSERNFAGGVYHWHEVFEFYHVFEGEFTLRFNGEDIRLKKYDTIFVNWCIPHDDKEYTADASVFSCRVDGHLLGSVSEMFKKYSMPNILFRNDEELHQIITEIVRLDMVQDIQSELSINTQLIKIFDRVLKENKDCFVESDIANRNLVIFREIFIYIKNNLNENISLDKMSEEIGLNKSYMCRVFKEITGYSIVSYFNIARCHKAIVLMSTVKSLSEISDMLGFCDYNYFSRCFKKTIGCSPTKFMKQ